MRDSIAVGTSTVVSDGVEAKQSTEERRGEVIDMLRELLSEGRDDAVVELVSKLVARNTDLEKRLFELLGHRRKNEGVSNAQLHLFVDALTAAAEPELAEADAKLREVSGIDTPPDPERKTKAAPQPPLRRPPPESAPRVENTIPVPDAERACPKCGAERTCIGHDVTEVIELIPPQIIVRVDRREKIACESCEGEIARAP